MAESALNTVIATEKGTVLSIDLRFRTLLVATNTKRLVYWA